MRRKVIDSKENIFSNKVKLIAFLCALSTSLSMSNAISVRANDNIEHDNVIQEDIIKEDVIKDDFGIDYVLKNIYQNQMSYLLPTIEKLKEFYNEEDKNNFIKDAYPNSYSVINNDFNYNVFYDGTGYNYITSGDYLEAIKNNDRLIRMLIIKRAGNARDTNYNIVSDPNSVLGFRSITSEENELIEKYSNILGKPYFLNENFISLIEKIKLGDTENIEGILFNSLKSFYNNQMEIIYNTRANLADFYSNKDNENFIKKSYINAYNSYNTDLNCYVIDYGGTYSFVDKDMYVNSDMDLNEKIVALTNLIRRNNIILHDFKIKRLGNARDTDYGLIWDGNGYRVKNQADYEIIDKYSEMINNNGIINDSIIDLFDKLSLFLQNKSNYSK